MAVVPLMSSNSTRVLRTIGVRHPEPVSGEELAAAAAMLPGMVLPIVYRLCDLGLVRRHWVKAEAAESAHSRFRCRYGLTSDGLSVANTAVCS